MSDNWINVPFLSRSTDWQHHKCDSDRMLLSWCHLQCEFIGRWGGGSRSVNHGDSGKCCKCVMLAAFCLGKKKIKMVDASLCVMKWEIWAVCVRGENVRSSVPSYWSVSGPTCQTSWQSWRTVVMDTTLSYIRAFTFRLNVAQRSGQNPTEFV